MIRAYGVLGPGGLVRRSIFIVDPEGIVRYRHVALLGLHYKDVEDLKQSLRAGAGRGAGLTPVSRRSWRAPSSQPSSRSDRQGRRLAGESIGTGPPIVLLHGITATRRYVVHGSKVLARRGHRQLSYDARGHGESDPAPADGGYSYAELVADLDAVVDAEVGRPAASCSSATRWGRTPRSPTRLRAANGLPGWW